MGNNDIPPPPPGWAIVPADDPRLKKLPDFLARWDKSQKQWVYAGLGKGDSVPDGSIATGIYALPIERPRCSVMQIPKGWTLYDGPRNWKLIKGAKFWAAGAKRWQQINGGAYTTGDGPIIIRKKKSITAYCATQCGEPTFCALAYKRSKTLAKVRELWGANYRKTHPELKIMKVIITEA